MVYKLVITGKVSDDKPLTFAVADHTVGLLAGKIRVAGKKVSEGGES